MVRKKPTAGIVLAAGMSSRFGRPKQLLELGGKSVLEWTLNACMDSKIERIYLILGYKHQQVLEVLSEKIRHPRLNIILNQNYKKGQGASLQAGVLEIRDTFPSVIGLQKKTSVCPFIKIKEAIRQFSVPCSMIN